MRITNGLLEFFEKKPVSEAMVIDLVIAELCLKSSGRSHGCFHMILVFCNFFSFVEEGKK